MAATCGVAVMAKASAPGRTKTRLSPPLTPEEAADCNTAFLRDAADTLLGLAAVGVRPAMAYAPADPEAEAFFRAAMPAGVAAFPCVRAGFGECLRAALTALFAAGHASAIVLNADSPTLPPALLARAARLLGEPGECAVLGPSTDGGYYLLGVKRIHPRLFEEIDWSTERVAAQTLERAAEIGLPVHVLPAWYDVDDAGGLRALVGELFEERPFSPDHAAGPAAHARALLAGLLAGTDLSRRLSPGPGAPAPT